MIHLSGLTFGYQRERLFHNLNLTLEPGNIYGLLGLNGSGKTSLLRLLTGMLFAKSGNLSVLGQNPAKRSPGFLSQIFVLPEELSLPRITIPQYEKIYAPFYPQFDHQRFEEYQKEFELPQHKRLIYLSYGQKKKFLLSFGLACNSALLILDEPTNGLDIPSKGQFRRLVAESLTEERIFILSTHQVKDVETLIDPLVILHAGKILLSQNMEELSARIKMVHSPMKPDPQAEGLLYTESAPSGFWTVWKESHPEGAGALELEVLFNTVLSQPEYFASPGNKQGVDV